MNKVINVSITGGIIGAVGTSPKSVLSRAISDANKNGWHVKQVVSASSGSFLYALLRGFVLLITLFLYTFEPGYYIILEKEIESKVEINKCSVCNEEINGGELFCPNCGQKQS